MQIEVNTGGSQITYVFPPEQADAALDFYDSLINTYQIISYKATLADGRIIHQVVA